MTSFRVFVDLKATHMTERPSFCPKRGNNNLVRCYSCRRPVTCFECKDLYVDRKVDLFE